jgi:hypothetical protein
MGLFSFFKGASYTDKVVDCLKKRRSPMFQRGLVDPLQVITFLGLKDKFLLYVEAGENNLSADKVAAFWFEKLEQVYMCFDMKRNCEHRPRLSMTEYGMLDEEQLPPNSVMYVQSFLKTQKNLELTEFEFIKFGLATQAEKDAHFRKQTYVVQVAKDLKDADFDGPMEDLHAFCCEAFETGVPVEECGGMYWEFINDGLSLAEHRRWSYHEAVMTLMHGDPRWLQHFKQHPKGVFAFVMNEEFGQAMNDWYDRSIPAEEAAHNLVRFFTDNPMPFVMQAALDKARASEPPIDELMARTKRWARASTVLSPGTKLTATPPGQ